jgi:hypothetical protein
LCPRLNKQPSRPVPTAPDGFFLSRAGVDGTKGGAYVAEAEYHPPLYIINTHERV